MNFSNGKIFEKTPIPETRKEKINLQEFLSYDNPDDYQYARLIREIEKNQGFDWIFTPYSQDTMKDIGKNKEIRMYIENKLKDKILIDLGCGGREMTEIPLFAKISKAQAYIGIDKHLKWFNRGLIPKDTKENPFVDLSAHISERRRNYHPMQFLLVKNDMLDFICRIPSNQLVNFTINGIDNNVIYDLTYHGYLAEELKRVMQKESIIFGIQSKAFDFFDPEYFKEHEACDELKKESFGFHYLRVFEKIK